MSINLDEIIIEPVLDAQSADINELQGHLRKFNHQQLWPNVKKPIGCFCRDLEGNMLGGVFGYDSWGWLGIELLWVDEKLRGNDIATTLMQKMEHYAALNGLNRIKLETGSFQALDFYKKIGFELYAELDDYPVGHKNYYLKKLLLP